MTKRTPRSLFETLLLKTRRDIIIPLTKRSAALVATLITADTITVHIVNENRGRQHIQAINLDVTSITYYTMRSGHYIKTVRGTITCATYSNGQRSAIYPKARVLYYSASDVAHFSIDESIIN